MNRKELLITQINTLSDSVIDNDTDYLNSIPGMAESIIQGMNTPIDECFETLE